MDLCCTVFGVEICCDDLSANTPIVMGADGSESLGLNTKIAPRTKIAQTPNPMSEAKKEMNTKRKTAAILLGVWFALLISPFWIGVFEDIGAGALVSAIFGIIVAVGNITPPQNSSQLV